jgi:hypothetical protein
MGRLLLIIRLAIRDLRHRPAQAVPQVAIGPYPVTFTSCGRQQGRPHP